MKKETIIAITLLAISGVLALESCGIYDDESFNETINFNYDSNLTGITGANCFMNAYYPNGTVDLYNVTCYERVNQTVGIYDCNVSIGSVYGVYDLRSYCESGIDTGVGNGCYESAAQTDREFVSDLLNPIGLIIISGALIYMGVNMKGKYGKYVAMFFIMFSLIWMAIAASAISETWGDTNIDTSVYGEASVAMGVYTMWILSAIMILFFLIFLLYDLGYIAGGR